MADLRVLSRSMVGHLEQEVLQCPPTPVGERRPIAGRRAGSERGNGAHLIQEIGCSARPGAPDRRRSARPEMCPDGCAPWQESAGANPDYAVEVRLRATPQLPITSWLS